MSIRFSSIYTSFLLSIYFPNELANGEKNHSINRLFVANSPIKYSIIYNLTVAAILAVKEFFNCLSAQELQPPPLFIASNASANSLLRFAQSGISGGQTSFKVKNFLVISSIVSIITYASFEFFI
jgi:hypothetical protein